MTGTGRATRETEAPKKLRGSISAPPLPKMKLCSGHLPIRQGWFQQRTEKVYQDSCSAQVAFLHNLHNRSYNTVLQSPVLQKLYQTISPDRLSRYLIATNGELRCAIRLYEINIRLSQTLYGILHGYEIALRNAMHDRLKEYFGQEDWYLRANLKPNHMDTVRRAQKEAAVGQMDGAPAPVGKVVAELGLGFWTGLAAAGYEQSLWTPCLRKAFPNITLPRKKAFPLLSDIRSVRNRVAHHERILGSNGTLYAGLHPIHRTELRLRPESILGCVAWICPQTSEWIGITARFQNCLDILGSDEVRTTRF